MVSSTTARVLTEKALQGTASGLHRNNLRGKLRLYADWMTEASWKDPTQKTQYLLFVVFVFNEIHCQKDEQNLPLCGMTA